MSTIHFLNVLEGDWHIIQHDSGRVSVIDICNGHDPAKHLHELLLKGNRSFEQKTADMSPEQKKIISKKNILKTRLNICLQNWD